MTRLTTYRKQFFMIHQKKIFIGLLSVFILVCFGLIGVAWKESIERRSIEERDRIMKSAEAVYDTGEATKAIALFRELIQESPNQKSDDTVTMRLKLAESLFTQDERLNQKEVIQIHKSIILDPEVSLNMRAIAVNDMLDYYHRNQDRNFAREVIFQGEVFGSFLKEGDLNRAMLQAYQYSDSLHQTPISSLRIAGYTLLELRNNGAKLSKEEQGNLYSEVLKRTQQGEDLIQLVFTTENTYKKTKISAMYLLAARNRADLANIAQTTKEDQKKLHAVIAEHLFQQSLKVLAPEDTSKLYIFGLYTRLYHAAFLARVFGEARHEEIRALLEPVFHTPSEFASLRSNSFDKLLAEHVRREYARATPEQVLVIKPIISVLPEFKEALRTNGVDVSMIQ